MMNKWVRVEDELPELGKRVLCFLQGDVYTAYHFDGYFFCFPFTNNLFSNIFLKPEKWQEIDFPEGYTGKMLYHIDGDEEVITASQYKERRPESYKKLVARFLESFSNLEEY